MNFLPEINIMDTVYIGETRSEVRPTTNKILSLICKHPTTEPYIRIDHRAGGGSFADNFKGEVCMGCGIILEEQTL